MAAYSRWFQAKLQNGCIVVLDTSRIEAFREKARAVDMRSGRGFHLDADDFAALQTLVTGYEPEMIAIGGDE